MGACTRGLRKVKQRLFKYWSGPLFCELHFSKTPFFGFLVFWSVMGRIRLRIRWVRPLSPPLLSTCRLRAQLEARRTALSAGRVGRIPGTRSPDSGKNIMLRVCKLQLPV